MGRGVLVVRQGGFVRNMIVYANELNSRVSTSDSFYLFCLQALSVGTRRGDGAIPAERRASNAAVIVGAANPVV